MTNAIFAIGITNKLICMTKFYSINEICRLTGVSVRTLHHYDEMNILKPHHRTATGHRRYSDDDLLQLQQIVTWKFMGFTLREIKQIFQQRNFNIFDALKIQEQALLEQINHIQETTKLIHYLITQHELRQCVDWKTVVQIIEVLKFKKIGSKQWYEKYLTESEQQQYNQHGLAHMDKWQALMDEVRDNLHTDPAGEQGLALINKCLTMAKEFYGDRPELINKLWEAFKAGVIPSQLPNDKEVIAYITKAFEKLEVIK